jgi:chromosome segregation ATPase
LEDQREKMDSYNTLQGKIDALVEERTEMQKKVTDSETEREKLFEQVQMEAAQRESQIETLNKQIDSLETNLKESIERENKLKVGIREKEEFIQKLRAVANKFKTENEKLKKDQTPNDEKLAELSKLHDALVMLFENSLIFIYL